MNSGKFSDVHAAIDVLYPRDKPEPTPQPSTQQLDPTTIPGAMNALGSRIAQTGLGSRVEILLLRRTRRGGMVKAHVLRILAVYRFTEAASHFRENHRIEYVYGWVDPVDDLFGNLLTQWKIADDRATGYKRSRPRCRKTATRGRRSGRSI